MHVLGTPLKTEVWYKEPSSSFSPRSDSELREYVTLYIGGHSLLSVVTIKYRGLVIYKAFV